MQLLVIADLQGRVDQLSRLVQRCTQFSLEGVCFCGNIVRGQHRREEWETARSHRQLPNRNRKEILEEALEDLKTYKAFCHQLDSLGIPVFVIPGEWDAPEERYFLFMQQAVFQSDNLILIHENTCKHRYYVFTGFGGRLTDQEKEDYFLLAYPRTEVLFGTRRMRFLNPPRVLLTYTAPVSAAAGTPLPGHGLVNELIAAINPAFLLCGQQGRPAGSEEIGRTLLVYPGSLAAGAFALLNTRTRETQLLTL